MLTIIVPGDEVYDELFEEFKTVGDVSLDLEHSLASLSKWESIHEKPFLGPKEKTHEEVFSYIECMVLTPDPPPEILYKLSEANYESINKYINAKSSATWFTEEPHEKKSREVITSELIYYWMFTLQIPIECEHWHLNRLFTLIKVFNVKNSPAKKMSPREIADKRRALNEQRKAELGTRG